MSSVVTDLRARAIHYTTEISTNHVLSRTNGYEGHHHKPPTSVHAQLLNISRLPRFSSYLFLDGDEEGPSTTRRRILTLARLYVPIINRPYSVVGPTNVSTERMEVTDASFFNEFVRTPNHFGPRARGWKCASSSASDVAVCICPALVFRRYLKQKTNDSRALLEYLKATSSDSLLCFNVKTMELTYSLPLASYECIGPCSDISAVPTLICITYLTTFMGLECSSGNTANEAPSHLPPGTFAALLTCCDARIYLIIVKQYKVKHIQLLTTLQPIPNLFVSCVTSLSVHLLSPENANSDVPRLLFIASGALALATPQPAVVSWLSGVKTTTPPPPVLCAFLGRFHTEPGPLPHLTLTLTLIASSFTDLLDVALKGTRGVRMRLPPAMHIVKHGKGPEIVPVGQYRLLLRPLYLRRNGPTTTRIAKEIAQSALDTFSGINISAGVDISPTLKNMTGNLIPNRNKIIEIFSRNLRYFYRAFDGSAEGTTLSVFLDVRSVVIYLRILLTDWLLFAIYLLGLFNYFLQGIYSKIFARAEKQNPKASKREAKGSYAIPEQTYLLLYHAPSRSYYFLIYLSDESIVGAKTINFLCDGAPCPTTTSVQNLYLYLVDRSTLQIPRNSHVSGMSTRPILLHRMHDMDFPINTGSDSSLETIHLGDIAALKKAECNTIQASPFNIPEHISSTISNVIRNYEETLHTSLSKLDYRRTNTFLDRATEQLKVMTSSSFLYCSQERRSMLSRSSSQTLHMQSTVVDSTMGVADTLTDAAPLLYLVMFSYTSNTFQLNMYAVTESISCCYSLPISLNAVEENINNLDTMPSLFNAVDYANLCPNGHSTEYVSQTITLENKSILTSVASLQDSGTADTGDSDTDQTTGPHSDAAVLQRTNSNNLHTRSSSRHLRTKMVERLPVICGGVYSCMRREDLVHGLGFYLVDYTEPADQTSKFKTPVKKASSEARYASTATSFRIIQLPVVREAVTMSFSFSGSVTKTRSILLPRSSGLYGCTTTEILFATKQGSRVAELLNLALTERTAFEYKAGSAYPRHELFMMQQKTGVDSVTPGSAIKQAMQLISRYVKNGKLLIQTHRDMLGQAANQSSLPILDYASCELVLLSMLYTIATKNSSEFYFDFTSDPSNSLNCYALEILITWFDKGPVIAFNALQKTSITDILASYRQVIALLYCIVRRISRAICDAIVLSHKRTLSLHNFLSLTELMSLQLGLTKVLETCYRKSITVILDTISMSVGLATALSNDLKQEIKLQDIFNQYYRPNQSAESAPFFISYNTLLHYVLELTGKDYSLFHNYQDNGLRRDTPEYLQHTNATTLFLAANYILTITTPDLPSMPGFLISYLHLYLCPAQYGHPNDIVSVLQQKLKDGTIVSVSGIMHLVMHAIIYRTLSQFLHTIISGQGLFRSFDSFPEYLLSGSNADVILLLKLWPLSHYMGCQTNNSSDLMRHLLTLNTAVTVLRNAKEINNADISISSSESAEQHSKLQVEFEQGMAQTSSFICRELAESLLCTAFNSSTYTRLLQQLDTKLTGLADHAPSSDDQSSSLPKDLDNCWTPECDQIYSKTISLSHKSNDLIVASPTISIIFDRVTSVLKTDSAMLQHALIEQLQYTGKYIGFFTALYYFVGYSFQIPSFLDTDQQISFVSTPTLGRCTPVTTFMKTTVPEEDSEGQVIRGIALSKTIVKRLIPRIEQSIKQATEYIRLFLNDLIAIRVKDGYVEGVSLLMRSILNINNLELSDTSDDGMLNISHMDAHFQAYELFKRAMEDTESTGPIFDRLRKELKRDSASSALLTLGLFSWKEFSRLPHWMIIYICLLSVTLLTSPIIPRGTSMTWVGHYYISLFIADLPKILDLKKERDAIRTIDLIRCTIPKILLTGTEVADAIDTILLMCINNDNCDSVFREEALDGSMQGVMRFPYVIQIIIAQYYYIKTFVQSTPPTKDVLEAIFTLLIGSATHKPFSPWHGDVADNVLSLPPFYPLYTNFGLDTHFAYNSFKPIVALLYLISLSEDTIATLTPANKQELYQHLVTSILTPEIRKTSKITEKLESLILLQDVAMTGVHLSPLSHLKLRMVQSVEKYVDIYRKMCLSFVTTQEKVSLSSNELENDIHKLLALTNDGELFTGIDGSLILMEHALEYRAANILSLLATRFDMSILLLETAWHFVQQMYEEACLADESALATYKELNDAVIFLYQLYDNIMLDVETHACALIKKHAASAALKGLSAQLLFFIDAKIQYMSINPLLTSIRGTSNDFSDLSSNISADTDDLAIALLGGGVARKSPILDWIEVYHLSFNYYWKQWNKAPITAFDAYYPSCISCVLASSLPLLSIRNTTGERSRSEFKTFLLYLLLITSFFYVPMPSTLTPFNSYSSPLSTAGLYDRILYCATATPLSVSFEPASEGQRSNFSAISAITKSIASLTSSNSTGSLYESLKSLSTSKHHNMYLHRTNFVRDILGSSPEALSNLSSACTLSTLLTCCYVSMLLEYLHSKGTVDLDTQSVSGSYIYKGLLSLISSVPTSNLYLEEEPLHFMGIPIPLLAHLKLPFIDRLMARLSRETWSMEPTAIFLYLSLVNSKLLSTGLFAKASATYTYELPHAVLFSFTIKLLNIEVSRADVSSAMQRGALKRLLLDRFSVMNSSRKVSASFLSLRDLQDDSSTENFQGLPYSKLMLPSQISRNSLNSIIKHAIASSTPVFSADFMKDRLYHQVIEGLSSTDKASIGTVLTALQELAALIDDPDLQDAASSSSVHALIRAVCSSLLVIYHGLLASGPFYTIVATILHIFTKDRVPNKEVTALCTQLREFASDFLLLTYILQQYCRQTQESLAVPLSLLSTFIPDMRISAHPELASKFINIYASNIVHGDPANHAYSQKLYSFYTILSDAPHQSKADFLLDVLKALPPCRKSWFIQWFTNKAITAALDLPHEQVQEVVHLAYTKNLIKDGEPMESSCLLGYLDLSSTVNISHTISEILENSLIVASVTNILSVVQNFIAVSKSCSPKDTCSLSRAYLEVLQNVKWEIASGRDINVLATVLWELSGTLLTVVSEVLQPTLAAVLAGETIYFLASHPALQTIPAVSVLIRRSIWNRDSYMDSSQINNWEAKGESSPSDRPVPLKPPMILPPQPKEQRSDGWDCYTDTDTDVDVNTDQVQEKPHSMGNCWDENPTDTDCEEWSSAEESGETANQQGCLSRKAFFNVLASGSAGTFSSGSDNDKRQIYIPLQALDVCASLISRAVRLRNTAKHHYALTIEYAACLYKGLFIPTDRGIPVTARLAFLNIDLDSAKLIARDFIIYILTARDSESAALELMLITKEVKGLVLSSNMSQDGPSRKLALSEVAYTLVAPLLLENVFEVLLSQHLLCRKLEDTIPLLYEDTIAFLGWIQENRNDLIRDFGFSAVDCIVATLKKAPEIAISLADSFFHIFKEYCDEEDKYTLNSEGSVISLHLGLSKVVLFWTVAISLCLSTALSCTEASDIPRLALIQSLAMATSELILTCKVDTQAAHQLLSKVIRVIAQLTRKFILTKLDSLTGITKNIDNPTDEFLSVNREILLLYIKILHMSDSAMMKHKLLPQSVHTLEINPYLSVSCICFTPASIDIRSDNDHLQSSIINLSSVFSLSPSVHIESQSTMLNFLLRMIALDMIRSSTKFNSSHYILFWEAVEEMAKADSLVSFPKLIPKLEEDANSNDRLLLFYSAFYSTTLADVSAFTEVIQTKLERILQLTAILSKPIIDPKTLCVTIEPNQYLERVVNIPLISVLGIISRGKDLMQHLQGTDFVSTLKTLEEAAPELINIITYKPSEKLIGMFPKEFDDLQKKALGIYAGIGENMCISMRPRSDASGDFRPLALLRTLASRVI